MVPFPSLRPPRQTADALRFMLVLVLGSRNGPIATVSADECHLHNSPAKFRDGRVHRPFIGGRGGLFRRPSGSRFSNWPALGGITPEFRTRTGRRRERTERDRPARPLHPRS